MREIELDELELKLKLLGEQVNLDNLTNSDICKLIQVNFDVACTEQDIFLLHEPKNLSIVDEAIITYRNLL